MDGLYIWINGLTGNKKEAVIENFIEKFHRKRDFFISAWGKYATFILHDYVGKVEMEDGTWYWTKFYLSDEACRKLNLGRTTVIFPDGFPYEFEGKMPNIRHHSERFAELWRQNIATKFTVEHFILHPLIRKRLQIFL